jgi:hypothetical protein
MTMFQMQTWKNVSLSKYSTVVNPHFTVLNARVAAGRDMQITMGLPEEGLFECPVCAYDF